jgi:subtilisin family serine protease
MKAFLIYTYTFLATFNCLAQDTQIIFLKDNTKTSHTTNYSEFLSPRSLARRERQNIDFNELDLPVNKDIIRILSLEGDLLNTSKWLNAVTLKTSVNPDYLLANYDFIERIQVVKPSKSSEIYKFERDTKSPEYGLATNQIEQLNLDCLHDLGYTGSGIYLGVIDAGFRGMDTISYFDSVHLENRILESYNFVNNSTDIFDYSGHGTAVSSCIVGEKNNPSEYAGTAVDVDLALFVTEDLDSETEIEEFNLVAALERADSIGTDVVNISLGYFEFDGSGTSHLFSDLDGVTTVAAIGVNIASTKGIFVTISAGNSGPANISTPCDAKGGYCAGAVNETGNYAFFSSVGPSADGRIKPDGVARGEEAWLISETGTLTQSNGTSFSSPILAGAVACLIQANPNKTVQEVMAAIRTSSSQYNSPDEFLGYGIPDFCIAHSLLNSDVSLSKKNTTEFELFPNPTRDYVTVKLVSKNIQSIKLINELGQTIKIINKDNIGESTLLDLRNLNHGLYIIQLTLNNGTQLHKKILVQD